MHLCALFKKTPICSILGFGVFLSEENLSQKTNDDELGVTTEDKENTFKNLFGSI